jgi:hypothetical protein
MARRSTCAWTAVLVMATLAVPASADDGETFRVRMAGSQHAQSVRRALKRAHARLAHPECRRLFTDFTDRQGRPLQERLDTMGLSGQQFLTYVGFYEGYGHLRCGQGRVMAFTQPGSLVVRVCPQIARHDPELVEMILLHEMLHSLGLGENPPSTFAITDQVAKRCGGGEKLVNPLTATR